MPQIDLSTMKHELSSRHPHAVVALVLPSLSFSSQFFFLLLLPLDHQSSCCISSSPFLFSLLEAVVVNQD